MPSEQQLRDALSLALCMLAPYEPAHSRAVSDEFVALAAVHCKLDDDKCWSVIDAALKRFQA